MQWSRRDGLIVLLLTLLGAVLRFHRLGDIPAGFHFDEAYNGLDAQLILSGSRPLFLPANLGREPAYSYYQAAIGALLGVNVFSLRLASALAGTVAIPTAYVLFRALLRRNSRAIAAFSTAALAVSLWHLHFSHYGIRVVTMPVILSGVFGCFWFGQQQHRVLPRLAGLVLSGLLAGLAVWTHPSGRLIPVVLVLYTLWLILRRPPVGHRPLQRSTRIPIIGLAVTGLVAFVVFLPLGLEFYRHPEFFFGHVSDVSVFSPRVGGEVPLRAAGVNALRVAGMFSIRGDLGWTHNLSGRPVFDPLLSIAFWVGVVVWLVRGTQRDDRDRDALVLLALWAAVMLSASVFSDDAPDFSRSTPALPALLAAVGLGLTWIMQRLNHRRARVGTTVAILVLVISGATSVYDYFVRFPRALQAYYHLYALDKVDAVRALTALAEDHQVYLSRLWAEHATVRFLSDQEAIKSIDTTDALVLPPPGRGAVYAFPVEQRDRAEWLTTLWPGSGVATVTDRFAAPLLVYVQVGQDQLMGWPPGIQPDTLTVARFIDGPTLRGASIEEQGAITLFWEAEQPMWRDLTSFVHLVDAEGRRVGQIDKMPANGSYRTPVWEPGERVIDRYRPLLEDPCARGEELRIQVGWYDLALGTELLPRADAGGNSALVGSLALPLRSVSVDDVQLALNDPQPFVDGLALTGHRIKAQVLQPGAPLRVDLYWQGTGDSSSTEMALRLVSAARQVTLWSGAVAPEAQWDEGQVLCRRLRLNLPIDLEPGTYQLVIGDTGPQASSSINVDELVVEPSTRGFERPELEAPLNISFADQVRLLGSEAITVHPADRELTANLAWQAIISPAQSYTVFVHLVDPSGRIVAQSDALPAGGYSTNQWLSGEVVLDSHTLSLPQALAPGQYRLLVGLYDAVSGQRLPAITAEGHSVPDDAAVVGEVTLDF